MSVNTLKTPPVSAARRRSASARKEQLEIVVRRGAARRFAALKKKTAELPVHVAWDRRKTDRRASSTPSMQVPRDRRATDRRQEPPFTWELSDFVIVDARAEAAATPRRRAKKR